MKVRLEAEAQIVGVARSPMTDDQFREHLLPQAKKSAGPRWDEARWREFAKMIHYVQGDATTREGIAAVKQWLDQREGGQSADRLYYLSVAPDLVPKDRRWLVPGRHDQRGSWLSPLDPRKAVRP